jgi:hypothetical protein
MALGPAGKHGSQESYSTPPTTVPNNNILSPDPGYVQPARSLQFGPQGNTGVGQPHAWPDSFHKTP